MSGVEIRTYSGDFEDIADLTREVWIPEYRGKTWIPVPDVAMLRWRLGPASGAVCLAAYAGSKLVGSISSVPHSLRIGSTLVPTAIYTLFTVDPEYRRMALPLVERLRRENEERGIALGMGMVLDDPNSISYRFWTKYTEAFPQNFRFLFRGGYWAKFVAPHQVARAAINGWERIACRALAPLLPWTPFGRDQHVRPYREQDLERCVGMLAKATASFDWSQLWPQEKLAFQLHHPLSKTLVYERDGRIQGMVNYHYMLMQGREPVRAAHIDLWAGADLTGAERVRFISHICAEIRDDDVHGVLAERCAMLPSAALSANGFFPAVQKFWLGVFLTPETIPLSPPKTWSLEVI